VSAPVSSANTKEKGPLLAGNFSLSNQFAYFTVGQIYGHARMLDTHDQPPKYHLIACVKIGT